MDLQVVVFFFIGLALLVLGAELLVRGSARLAAAAGVSSLVIGLEFRKRDRRCRLTLPKFRERRG